MTYDELQAALEVFGLDDGATMAEIKQRHRELVKRHHPDGDEGGHATAQDQQLIRRINAAHRIINDYVNNYRFSFNREEFYRQNPEARLYHQFDHDPIWGPGRKN